MGKRVTLITSTADKEVPNLQKKRKGVVMWFWKVVWIIKKNLRYACHPDSQKKIVI